MIELFRKITNYITTPVAKDGMAEHFINTGNLHYNNKEYDLALEQYTAAIRLNSNHFDAYLNRGCAYLMLGNKNSSALEDFNTAISINPKHFLAYYNRGLTYHRFEKIDAALKDYDRTIELNPNYSSAYISRGLLKADFSEDYGAALKDYNHVLHSEDTSVEDLENTYLNRALLRSKLDDIRGAIQDYSKIIELNATSVLAYNNRAYYKNKLKDYQGAILDCDRAIELDDQYAYAYNNKGYAQFKLGHLEAALENCNHSMKLDMDNSYVYYYRALILAKLGKEEMSKNNLQKSKLMHFPEKDRDLEAEAFI